MISSNLRRVREEIEAICRRIGRNAEEVTLIGVTKYAEAERIQEAIQAGLKHVGENKVQEAKRKFPLLEQLHMPVTRHMIGHLQTNKVKQALEVFDMIQSVDSLHLAQAISKQAEKSNRTADILVQVNTSGEEQKFGMAPSSVDKLLEDAFYLRNIRILGLMTMAPLTQDTGMIRRCFRDLKVLSDTMDKKWIGSSITMKHLSMGMSDDYPIALEEGANMLRIGRAIFQQ